MTKTLIEQIEKLQRYDYESRGYMGFKVWQSVEDGKGEYIRTDDLRAIIEQYKTEGAEPVAYADPQAFVNFKNAVILEKEWMWSQPDSGLVPLFTSNYPYPSIVGELVKALEEIAKRGKTRVFADRWSDLKIAEYAESALARAKAMTE